MSSKILDQKTLADISRYTSEELDPQSAEDEAAVEAFIARNREAINRALEQGYLSLSRGGGTEIRSLDDLLSAVEAEKAKQRRKS
jgi:hypothetical protein